MKNNILFISGIGTNVGKSYATGWLANILKSDGRTVMTQKMIQTGNQEYSEDIDVHRQIMGIEMMPEDIDHTTAPIIMSYPASPHLAAKIDGISINLDIITEATAKLSTKYDTVLLEGAGGLMVPITETYLTIDYIKDNKYPVVLVTNGTLGSLNHTILSIESLKRRGIEIPYIIYNSFFDEDVTICDDTKKFIENYIGMNLSGTKFLIMPSLL